MRGGGRRLLLLLALLLLSSALFSQVWHGPDLPEGWWPIHDRHLQRIDEIFEMQKALAIEQRALLDEAATQLNEALRQLTTALQQSSEAESLLEKLRISLTRAEESSLELEGAIGTLTRQRNLAMVSSGIAAVLAVWLAIR